MMARQKFRTKEARRRARFRLALKVVVLCFAVVAVGSSLIYVVQLDSMRMRSVYVETSGALDQEQVAETIHNELATAYFGLVPKNFIFFPTPSSIERKLFEVFPRSKDITIQRTGLHTLHVGIVEREPDALWCGDVVPPIAENQTSQASRENATLWGTCYLMDKDSFIYAKAPLYSGDVFPRYYGSLNKAEPVGQYYLPKEQFWNWQAFYRSLSYGDTLPQAVLFADERDAEVYLSNGIKVLVPRLENIDTIQHRLTSVLDSDAIDLQKPVEYVDMRFGDKAFVKYGSSTEER